MHGSRQPDLVSSLEYRQTSSSQISRIPSSLGIVEEEFSGDESTVIWDSSTVSDISESRVFSKQSLQSRVSSIGSGFSLHFHNFLTGVQEKLPKNSFPVLPK